MDKVSIIIPTYNVEKYFDQCLESVCGQTYQNLEIIIVDDGSTDKTEEIAHKWAMKDKRINVITQKNAGSGEARNNGLSHAHGKYVMFVDSDDWIDKVMVEDLMEQVNQYQVDFLATGLSRDYFKNDIFQRSDVPKLKNTYMDNPNEIHQNYVRLLINGAVGGPVRKIYKLDIIQKHHIQFPNYKRSQDIVFNYRYIDCIKSLFIYDSNYYHYRINEESYHVKIREDYYKIVGILYSDIRALLKKWDITLSKKDEQDFVQYFYNLIIWQISLGKSASVMNDLVNHEAVLDIVSKSEPKGAKQKVLNYLILKKKDRMINKIISILKKFKKA